MAAKSKFLKPPKRPLMNTAVIICPACGKELSPETNDEQCPKSLAWHKKHPICVVHLEEVTSWNSSAE